MDEREAPVKEETMNDDALGFVSKTNDGEESSDNDAAEADITDDEDENLSNFDLQVTMD